MAPPAITAAERILFWSCPCDRKCACVTVTHNYIKSLWTRYLECT